MRPPDRNAPRFRTKWECVNTPEFIRKFKEKYPQYAHYNGKVLMGFLNRHCDKITEAVATTREGVELPEGIGYLFVVMVTMPKRKETCVSWGKSLELGVIVHYSNHHTDGKMPKIMYSNCNTKYKFENRQLWGFTACRNFKQLVSSLAEEMYTIYTPLVSRKKIQETIMKTKIKNQKEYDQNEDLKVYNEFE